MDRRAAQSHPLTRMAVRGILVDAYRTIIDTKSAFSDAVKEYVAGHYDGVEAELLQKEWSSALNGMWSGPFQTMYEMLVNSLKDALNRMDLEPNSPETAVRLFYRNSRTFIAFPDARDLFHILNRRSIPVAVVSNADAALLPWHLARCGLRPDAVVCSDEVGVTKPHASIFQKALEILGLQPYEVVMVGDNPLTDIDGARRLNIPAFLVRRAGGLDSAHTREPRITNNPMEASNPLEVSNLLEVLDILDIQG